MSIEIGPEGKRGLEEEFFARLNQELRERIRADANRKDTLAELSQATGIKDEKVLGIMVDAHITASTLQTMSLVPLVRIAWADGTLDQKEQGTILKAAAEQGITTDHPGFAALQAWLQEPPSDSLFHTWRAYVQELGKGMSAESFALIGQEILERSQRVAEAAGGILGFGSKVSPAEKDELDRIKSVFSIR